jgi:hypothetical protein
MQRRSRPGLMEVGVIHRIVTKTIQKGHVPPLSMKVRPKQHECRLIRSTPSLSIERPGKSVSFQNGLVVLSRVVLA